MAKKPVAGKTTPVAEQRAARAIRTNRNAENARMLDELLETAVDLNAYGVLTKGELSRVRALCEPPPIYTPERVALIRTSQAKMSQAVFAAMLNVSVSTVQKWESPTANKRPSGPAAKLLQLLEQRGLQVLLD
jgi:putative transcriptional regulator